METSTSLILSTKTDKLDAFSFTSLSHCQPLLDVSYKNKDNRQFYRTYAQKFSPYQSVLLDPLDPNQIPYPRLLHRQFQMLLYGMRNHRWSILLFDQQ